MPSLGSFAITPPATGQLRIFHQTQNDGTEKLRAITISTTDLNGRILIPSLRENESVRTKVLSNGQRVTMGTTSISQNVNYFYLNIEENIVDSISGSLNQIVNLDPFLVQNFFNSDFNSLISNATLPRKSKFFREVDSQTDTVPANYYAIRGTEIRTIPAIIYSTGTQTPSIPYKEYFLVDLIGVDGVIDYTNQVVSKTGGVTVKVTQKELDRVIGYPQVRAVEPESGSLPAGEQFTSYLYVRLSGTANFNTYNTSSLIAKQIYNVNRDKMVLSETYPMNVKVEEAHQNGSSFLHVKVFQVTERQSGAPSVNNSSKIRMFPMTTRKPGTKDDLTILFERNNQIPYAPIAAVQDSNYSSTAFVNARYAGTKTTRTDYAGIDPAIRGTVFPAAIFPSASAYSTIFNKSENIGENEIEQLLFDGEGEFPTFAAKRVGRILKDTVHQLYSSSAQAAAAGVAGNFSTVGSTNYTFIKITLDSNDLQPGDVIAASGPTSGSGTVGIEFLQIVSINEVFTAGYRGGTTWDMQVRRGFANTDLVWLSGSQLLTSLSGNIRVFKLVGSQLEAVQNKMIMPDPVNAEETSSMALYVNGLGFISDGKTYQSSSMLNADIFTNIPTIQNSLD